MIKDDYIMSQNSTPTPIQMPTMPDTSPAVSPRSPICGYCSDEGQLYVASNGNIQCKDCYGIAYMENFIPLPQTDTPWPKPRTVVMPMTPLRKWIHRKFMGRAD